MPTVEIIQYIPVGCPNDQINLSKALKEEPFRKLKEVALTADEQSVKLTFSKKVWDDSSHNFKAFPKRVLQISKRKFDNVDERIKYILDNEQKPISTFRYHKDWHVLKPIIELKDKWLVFMI